MSAGRSPMVRGAATGATTKKSARVPYKPISGMPYPNACLDYRRLLPDGHAFVHVTSRVGNLWFVGAYVASARLGLALLLISELRHSRFVRENVLKENSNSRAAPGTIRLQIRLAFSLSSAC